MAKFKVIKEVLKDFIEKCACVGIINFRDKKGVKKPLFSCFYLDVKDGKIKPICLVCIKHLET